MVRLYETFLTSLSERHPSKPDLVNALMDILHLEKESIYRRLRKDVYFSSEEMLKIASEWDISLDNIVISNPSKSRPFRLVMINFADPKEEDYGLLEQHNKNLALVAADPKGRMFEALNSFPYGLYCRSDMLTRFFTMKWLYKYADPDMVLPLSEIHLSDRMRRFNAEHLSIIHSIPEVHSIHDPSLIENLIGEIVYYHSIGMVSDDDNAMLKNELFSIIDYMEEVAARGCFPSGKKMYFYLSHTWIDSQYILFKSKHFNVSLVKILERNLLGSTDKVVLERLINKTRSIKRSSVLLSESNVLQRIEFFSRQRKVIDKL